jgi:NADH-quinone oxidoreductase subunit E
MPLLPETIVEIERIRAALPEARSALLPALKVAQRERGWLPQETLGEVAGMLGLDANAAYMLATFYTMLHTEPVNHYALEACRSLPCYLNGCDDVLETLRRELQPDEHGNSADGYFSLKIGECLGDCPHAPMMRVNDDFVGPLSPETLPELLSILRQRARPAEGDAPVRVIGLMGDPAAGPPPNEGPLTFTNEIRALPLARAKE